MESDRCEEYMVCVACLITGLAACTIGGACRKSPEKLKSALETCERNYADLQDLCPEDIEEDRDMKIGSLFIKP